MKKSVAVIAIGGNSLIRDKAHKTVEDQYEAARETCQHIAGLIERGWEVVITHGNGPQVGFIFLRAEIARKAVGLHPVPLDACGADTQGALGYALQQNLHNIFLRRGIRKKAATVVTQVVVSRDDPAFENPSKPIGDFYTSEEAAERTRDDGWAMVEDAGRGWRRVVPSPEPLEIVEIDTIRDMIGAGTVTIAVGGGGIPVARGADGALRGVEAVIDKDLATSLLARLLAADLFVISTAVERVALDYRKPGERWLDRMTAKEAREYLAEGHFGKGSMGPKIEAVVRFLEASGGEAIITDPPNIGRALDGRSGTRIVP